MKWIGFVVLAVGGAAIFAAPLVGRGGEALLICGIGLQLGGLWLWEKLRNYRDVTRDSSAVSSSVPRDVQLERIQATLHSLQDELGKVREDRDFYQRLYGSESRRQVEAEYQAPMR